jgi:RNA polymerase sigma-70 factor (ECF subfamily)
MTVRSISRLGGMHALPATVLGLAACGGGTGNATATSAPSKSSSGRPPPAAWAPGAALATSPPLIKRLDPEALGAHRGRLLRAARLLCDSRENAEDLVQETFANVLSRPRVVRGDDEVAYLMQALRNTFLTAHRAATRRPRVGATLQDLDHADPRTGARPEEALTAREVFAVIAELRESFRLALVAVDVAGLSYREAARVLGAPEATITTRLYRGRRLVARALDPERFAAGRSKCARAARDRPADGATVQSSSKTVPIGTTRTTGTRPAYAR